jgi:drug/metabolite transporter (DMT)-like permease
VKRLPKGVGSALLAALLFGLSTPFAKMLLGAVPPLLLAGLLYLGSGIGLTALRLARRLRGVEATGLAGRDLPWLAGAVLFGGVLGPVLLMVGLRRTPASATALLLNLEGVFTALLAWFVFKENFDRRIALGMGLIVAGGAVLSWQGGERLVLPAGALAVAGACLCWAVDNNLTQKVSAADPLLLASVKGLVAGLVNTGLGLVGRGVPGGGAVAAAMLLGLVGYGLSLALFVLALRNLGTARTGAYFSLAPFMGAAFAVVLLHDPLSPALLVAGVLMGAGAWLHLTERHEHEHVHEPMTHSHSHVHDEHHRHQHELGTEPGEPHTHPHVHEPLVHRHPHYPDIHHRHGH